MARKAPAHSEIPAFAGRFGEAPSTKWFEDEIKAEPGWQARQWWWELLCSRGDWAPTNRKSEEELERMGGADHPDYGVLLGYATQKQLTLLLRSPEHCRALLGNTLEEIAGTRQTKEKFRIILNKLCEGSVQRSMPGWDKFEQDTLKRERLLAQMRNKPSAGKDLAPIGKPETSKFAYVKMDTIINAHNRRCNPTDIHGNALPAPVPQPYECGLTRGRIFLERGFKKYLWSSEFAELRIGWQGEAAAHADERLQEAAKTHRLAAEAQAKAEAAAAAKTAKAEAAAAAKAAKEEAAAAAKAAKPPPPAKKLSKKEEAAAAAAAAEAAAAEAAAQREEFLKTPAGKKQAAAEAAAAKKASAEADKKAKAEAAAAAKAEAAAAAKAKSEAAAAAKAEAASAAKAKSEAA